MRFQTLLILFVLFLSGVSAQELPAQAPRSLTVVGTAQTELAPDHYLISVLIKAEGKTMELARAEYRKRFEELKLVFNEMDFPELAIVSAGRNISDSEQVDPNQMQMMFIEGQGEPEPKEGFFIRERVDFRWNVSPQLSSSDLEAGLANLLDRIKAEKLSFAVQQNVNYYPLPEVNLVTGGHSQLQSELRKLRTAAMADAREQANELASLAGGKLGRVLEIEIPTEESVSHYSDSGEEFGVSNTRSNSRFGSKLELKVYLRVKFELE